MYIKQSYDDDFQHLMLDMKDKYPKSIFELNGISDEDLDRTKFAKKYFTKKNGIPCLTRAFFGSVRPRTSPVSVGMLMTSESVIGQNSKNWKQAWNSTSSQHIFIGDIRRQD